MKKGQQLAPGTKFCYKCKKRKSIDGFHKNHSKSGREGQCKSCKRAYIIQYEARHPGIMSRNEEARRVWSVLHPRTPHDYRKWKYGLTVSQFNDMMIGCHGRCEICNIPLLPPVVDHCHETGVNRGLLCHACNRAIGQLGDSSIRCASAAAYLEKHNK